MSEEPTTIVRHHHESSNPTLDDPNPFPPPAQIIHHQHDRGFPAQDNPNPFPPPAQIIHHQHDRGFPAQDNPNPFPPAPPQYGTFSGVPAMGFPQPAPPRGSMDPSLYFARGYQSVPGYVVAEGTPVRNREHEHRLPCCGIGYGWFLFIIGFFLLGIPWYMGAFLLIFCKRTLDDREKPGYVACTIATVLAIIAIVFGVVQVDY